MGVRTSAVSTGLSSHPSTLPLTLHDLDVARPTSACTTLCPDLPCRLTFSSAVTFQLWSLREKHIPSSQLSSTFGVAGQTGLHGTPGCFPAPLGVLSPSPLLFCSSVFLPWPPACTGPRCREPLSQHEAEGSCQRNWGRQLVTNTLL